ncbi:MAG: HNH endonuclease signature motif containing protein, partial [Woeseiaceae bacterium]
MESLGPIFFVNVSAAARRKVWERANETCEYCRMPQMLDPAGFEVDHIIPEKMNGPSEVGNLALACFKCNNHKGPNIAAIDPDTGDKAYLFDPRSDDWQDHFHWNGPVLVGLSATGRATITLLQINTSHRIAHRRQLIAEGVFPLDASKK